MNVIVAVDSEWGIGYKGDLLARVKEDQMCIRDRDIAVTKQQGTNLTLELKEFNGKLSGDASAEVLLYGKANADDKLNEDPLDRAVIQLKDYIVQLGADTVFCVVDAMSTEEKAALVTGYNILTEHESPVPGAVGATAAFEKYGIPSILFAWGGAGISVEEKTTLYPSVSVLASTWNQTLAETVGASPVSYTHLDVYKRQTK